jgi:hypothetical protein
MNFCALQILPKLSTQTLSLLLTSDELWVPSEEKRFDSTILSYDGFYTF